VAVDTEALAHSTPPGPRGSRLLGSALDLKRDVLGTFHRAMLEYGDVVRFVAGPPGKLRAQFVAFFHPDGVQHVLAGASDVYLKGDPVYQEIKATLGDGLLTSEGERWRRQKRLIQPLFTHRRVASYVPMMAEEAAATVTRWRDAAGRGEPVDLGDEMAAVTLKVVGRALFGRDVGDAVPVIRKTVPFLSERAVQRGLSPLPIPRTWPTPANRRAESYQAALYRVVDEIVAERRAAPTTEDDMLGLLLGARDPEGGGGLDDDEVRDQVLIFLLAGHETTATSLTFTLHLLGLHPEIQERVFQEAKDVLGDRQPTLEDVPALAYTTMSIKEAMRLYPAAYAMGRLAMKDDSFNGYEIPAGTGAVASPWATHRHPRFWDEPERFNPERFTPERERARPRYAYFPFGGGPRACIGSYFSMLEAAIVTAMLVKDFRVVTPPGPVKLFTGITLRPGQPMPCYLEPR
jgi:cytochrome P450